jgi:hypothetical protein
MVTERRGPSPSTLMEAHVLLSHMRPGPKASAETWLRYYRRSAAVYAEVAEVDRGHHHEALYWANRERARANSLAGDIAKNPTPPTVKSVKDEGEKSEPNATVHTEQ